MTRQISPDPLRLQTGGRKTNAKNRGFADSIQVDITVAHIRMMRIAENIHATYPQYATVAPIFQGSVRAYRLAVAPPLTQVGAAA
jgi:hypothetical protein